MLFNIIRFLAFVAVPTIFTYAITVAYINRDTLIFSILLVVETLILFEIGYRCGKEKL